VLIVEDGDGRGRSLIETLYYNVGHGMYAHSFPADNDELTSDSLQKRSQNSTNCYSKPTR
jgi:hypothetical protein